MSRHVRIETWLYQLEILFLSPSVLFPHMLKFCFVFQIKKLKQQLDEERERSALAEKYSSPRPSTLNGPDMQLLDLQSKNSQSRIWGFGFFFIITCSITSYRVKEKTF